MPNAGVSVLQQDARHAAPPLREHHARTHPTAFHTTTTSTTTTLLLLLLALPEAQRLFQAKLPRARRTPAPADSTSGCTQTYLHRSLIQTSVIWLVKG
jgi:hypothetical protein